MDATLGERELDVMGELWRGGPGTVAEMRERLSVSLAYNTVLTILRNLESKGFVAHTAEGRLFRYFPVVSEQSVRGSALSRLVHTLFGGSSAHVVAHLVEDESLSPVELRELHQLLAARLSSAAEEQAGPRPEQSAASVPRRVRRPA